MYMNPQSRKNPLDQSKYRENYMSNLALQASNNQKNLNANVIFKQTGVSPEQPTDLRTTTEKAADLEGMKREIRSWLVASGICKSGDAEQVVLNLHRNEMVFIIERKEFIEKDFKARNTSYMIFLKYIEALIEKEEFTNGVDFGLQQRTGEDMVLSLRNIEAGMVRPDDIGELIHTVGQAGELIWSQSERHQAQNVRSANLLNQVQQARHNERMEQGEAAMGQSRAQSIVAGNEGRNIANNATQGTRALIRELQETKSAVADIYLELGRMQQIPQADQANILILINQLAANMPTRAETVANNAALVNAIQARDQRLAASLLDGIQEIMKLQPATHEIAAAIKMELGRGKHGEADVSRTEVKQTAAMNRKAMERPLYPPSNLTSPPSSFSNPERPKGMASTYVPSMSALEPPSTGRTATYSESSPRGNVASQESQDFQSYLGGNGFRKMKGRGVAHRMDSEYVKPKQFTQFGRYVINKTKLEGGILAIKRPSGTTISNLKSMKMSNTLSHIIKALTRGEKPSYNDLDGLSEEDKILLHDIIKKTQFDFEAPNPRKNDIEKENDRFDILRGEIAAGNNNKELIKEFKTMLLRFADEGRIPKGQVREILLDLTSLGF